MNGAPSARDDRMLLVFPGALGDFLLLAPGIAALRHGGAAVELSVRRALAPLAQELFPGPAGPPADGAAMRSLFAAGLDPTLAAWLRGATHLATWLGEPAVVACHARALGITHVQCLHVERGEAGPHASTAYASALGVVAVPPERPAAWRAEARVRGDALVLHPGAGSPAKRWPARGFHAVADAWRAGGGATVVVLGPAEEGEAAAWCDGGHEVASGLELPDVARLLAGIPRYVGNDSGPTHLAALAGCRGVALFGPTRAERWRPLHGGIAGGIEPLVYTGRSDEELRARILARLSVDGRLDTPTHRH